jgi:hypothetical protein
MAVYGDWKSDFRSQYPTLIGVGPIDDTEHFSEREIPTDVG